MINFWKKKPKESNTPSSSERTPPTIPPEVMKDMKFEDVEKAMRKMKFSMDSINQLAKNNPNDKMYQDIKNPEEFKLRSIALQVSLIGQYEKAIEYCNQGLKINPNSPFLFYLKGRSEADIGNFNEGILDLGTSIKLRPDFEDAYVELGTICEKVGMPEQAIASYDKALQIEPDSAELLDMKGNALYNLDRYEEAILCYDKALRIRPDLTSALNNKGLALAKLGKA